MDKIINKKALVEIVSEKMNKKGIQTLEEYYDRYMV